MTTASQAIAEIDRALAQGLISPQEAQAARQQIQAQLQAQQPIQNPVVGIAQGVAGQKLTNFVTDKLFPTTPEVSTPVSGVVPIPDFATTLSNSPDAIIPGVTPVASAPNGGVQLAGQVPSQVGQVVGGTVSPVGNVLAGNFTTGSVLGTVGGVAGAVGIGDLLANSQKGNHLGATAQGAASGAAIGNAVAGPAGAVPGAVIGGTLGLVKSFEGGKSERQIARDGIRNGLQNIGIAFIPEGTVDHHIQLADGSLFNIGKDGGSSFVSFDGTGEVKNGYEVDWTNPVSDIAAGAVNPLFNILTGGLSSENGGDSISSLVNGVMSNANGNPEIVLDNVRKLYNDAGITPDVAFAKVNQLYASGRISREEALAYQNAINETFDTTVISPTSGPLSLGAIEQSVVDSGSPLVNDIFGENDLKPTTSQGGDFATTLENELGV